jgi:hypothetical protein
MLVDCITKPVNGSQLSTQISFSIGQRFYPDSSLQHYHDLDLDNYSWRSRLLRPPKSKKWHLRQELPFILHYMILSTLYIVFIILSIHLYLFYIWSYLESLAPVLRLAFWSLFLFHSFCPTIMNAGGCWDP